MSTGNMFLKKTHVSFFSTIRTQMRLLLQRYIHYFNRKRTQKVTPGRESANAAKSSSDFEIKSRN